MRQSPNGFGADRLRARGSEAPTYTLAAVDVTYTYKPFIPLFSFPKLHISATLPSTAIHRKAVVRMLQ